MSEHITPSHEQASHDLAKIPNHFFFYFPFFLNQLPWLPAAFLTDVAVTSSDLCSVVFLCL